MQIKLESYTILFLLIVFSSSCSKGNRNSIDILQNISKYTFLETRNIDFRQGHGAKDNLLRGWAKPEKNYTWTNGNSSELFFYSYAKNQPLKLKISCKSVPLRKDISQVMAIAINGVELPENIRISPLKFNKYNLKIPARFLKSGYNLLKFKPSSTILSKKIFPNSHNNIPIAIAFQKIRVVNSRTIFFSQNILTQSVDSELSVYLKLPKTFDLKINYASPPNISAILEILPEKGPNAIIHLPTNKKEYRQTIHTNGRISKVILKSVGGVKGNMVWEQITASHNTSLKQSVMVSPTPKNIKPDILLYVVDTLRADHLHCYGAPRGTSPNIDQFAKENALFLNAYSNDSWTKPSAATILTGLYPKHHKATQRSDKLPSDVVTLAEYLHDKGYFTAGFIANGNLSHVFGFDQGFDIYQEHFNLDKNSPQKQVVLSDQINKHVFKFLSQYTQQENKKPLFLLVWTVDPHAPYTPPASVKNLFKINTYSPVNTYVPKLIYNLRIGAIRPTPSQLSYIKTRYDQEIFFNDKSFGDLLNKLKALQLYRNSIVVFTGDHGEEFLDHGGAGHGRTLYNELVKIPLIIKSPRTKKGSFDELVQHMDIFPSIITALGNKIPSKMDGIDISNNHSPNRTLFLEENLDRNEVWAIVDKNKKLIFNKRVNRSIENNVPYVEIYKTSDKAEQKPLKFSGTEDQYMLQELTAYRESKQRSTNFKREKARIPKKLDNKLKELGYAK